MSSEPTKKPRFQQARTEAANRAEATALLIRCDYRVYRPEADIEGEDLVIRTPAGELFGVQLKGRPVVDWPRYGDRGLLMLFPSALYRPAEPRTWFLVPHDPFYAWVLARHGHAKGGNEAWSYPGISQKLAAFLAPHAIVAPAEPNEAAGPATVVTLC
jgi:hypothetical protein